MLLAIDIGNTNISLGLFSGRRLAKRYFIPTQEKSCYSHLNKFLKKRKKAIQDTIICSVVPQVSQALARDLKRLLGKKPIILGKDTTVPIKNLYRCPGQVGQDRLVNAYAASAFYGTPAIVVDFGTAITFDIISKNGEYLGGMILPGLRISLDSLAERTALLPRVSLNCPRELIGRDTKNSILSGIVYGFAAMADNLSERIKRIIGRNACVIGTGGNISLIAKYCRKLNKVDRDLTLKGLNLLYRRQAIF